KLLRQRSGWCRDSRWRQQEGARRWSCRLALPVEHLLQQDLRAEHRFVSTEVLMPLQVVAAERYDDEVQRRVTGEQHVEMGSAVPPWLPWLVPAGRAAIQGFDDDVNAIAEPPGHDARPALVEVHALRHARL